MKFNTNLSLADDSSDDENVESEKSSFNFYKITTLLLLLAIVFFIAADLYLLQPSKEEVVDDAMDYINNNLFGDEDTELVSYSETESDHFYRIDIRLGDDVQDMIETGEEVIDIYVTVDGNYIFFEPPTEID